MTTPAELSVAAAMAPLTEREMQVLYFMSHGLPNAEIGKQLYLSEDTIKTHARRMFRKMGVRDRAHAVRVGFTVGLLKPEKAMGRPPVPSRGGRPVVDWQESERSRIAELRAPRPISVRHIAACDAAQSCPCRTTSTWAWPKGQVFADPVPMPERSA